MGQPFLRTISLPRPLFEAAARAAEEVFVAVDALVRATDRAAVLHEWDERQKFDMLWSAMAR